MDFRAEDGLLNKIHALVAPPQTSQTQKNRGGRKTRPVSGSVGMVFGLPALKHPAIQNHPYCDACGDGGNLLCCDKCPSSFHFFCCDPPVDPKQLPSGDWLCRRCRVGSVGEGVPPLFKPLIEKATGVNPLIFDIPLSLQSRDIIPGGSRKDLTVKQKRNAMSSEDKQRYCFACNKSSRFGCMVSCDFCPLMFHLDCLEPPLTALPTTAWLCPVHPNNKIPGSDHPRLTERLRAMEESRADVVQHTVKLDFIDKIRKIPAYKRITHHHNRRVSEVPPPIKTLYSSPLPDVSHVAPLSLSLVTPRESMERQRLEDERERKLFTQPRLPLLTKDQDDWTRWAVLCQVKEQAPSIPTSLSSSEPKTSSSQELSDSDNSNLSASKSDISISFNDSSVSSDKFAASVLLELAGNKAVNVPKEISRHGLNPFHSLPNGFVASSKNQYQSTSTMRYPESSYVSDHRTVAVSGLDSSGHQAESCKSAVMNNEVNHTQDTVSTQKLFSNYSSMTNKSKFGNGDSEDVTTKGSNLFTISPTAQFQHSGCKTMKIDLDSFQIDADTNGPSVSLDDDIISRGQSESVHNNIGHNDIIPCSHMEEAKEEKYIVFEEVKDEERDSELEVVDGTDSNVIACSPFRIEVSSEESDMEVEVDVGDLITSFSAGFVPDLSHLDERMVRLLATQRIQQLFSVQSTNTDSRDTFEVSPPHSPNHHLKDLCKEKFLGSKRLNGLQVPTPESSTSRNSPSNMISRAALTNASALLCPISGNGYPFAFENRVTYLGTGSGVDINLFKYGHCNYITEKHACVFLDKETGDFELLNYSEFGSVVDGILYSCDFSDKQPHSEPESTQESSPVPLVLDDIIALGHGRRARQAKGRLELARKSLSDKRKAKEALEGALKLAIPVSAQDDALLAEELSKSEGLMTRTGLKRVSADTSSVNPSVVSIPLAKAHDIDMDCSSQTKAGNHEAKPVLAKNLMSLMSKSVPTPTNGQPVYSSPNSLTTGQSSTTPCMCGGDPSSSNESNGKRLEGTGVLSHGSQLKFGCLQFLFSVAGCPGHEELLFCLLDGDDPAHATQLS